MIQHDISNFKAIKVHDLEEQLRLERDSNEKKRRETEALTAEIERLKRQVTLLYLFEITKGFYFMLNAELSEELY